MTEIETDADKVTFLKFLCYPSCEWNQELLSMAMSWWPKPIVQSFIGSIRAYENDCQPYQYPGLIWVRSYDRTRGDFVAAGALCRDLQRTGADGNLALNFPAGYCRRSVSTTGTSRWDIDPRIWLALHGWNFRLNRARGKPFSESDIWYVARVLKSWERTSGGASSDAFHTVTD